MKEGNRDMVNLNKNSSKNPQKISSNYSLTTKHQREFKTLDEPLPQKSQEQMPTSQGTKFTYEHSGNKLHY